MEVADPEEMIVKKQKFRSKIMFQICRNEKHRPCGLMDKALVFGTKDCRFESCQGQLRTAFCISYANANLIGWDY